MTSSTTQADSLGEAPMYWILNSDSIGLAARQNELIELSLTYKFAGFDIDINEFHGQAQESGITDRGV